MKSSVLIVDDDVDICKLLEKYLIKRGFNVSIAFSAEMALEKFKEEKQALVLCDYRLRDNDGMDVLLAIKKIHPEKEVIIITAYSDIHTAVRVIKSGAYDYICKPIIPEKLLHVIDKALAEKKNKQGTRTEVKLSNTKEQSIQNENYFKGESEIIKELYRKIELVAPTRYSVIIYGESGSGKEVIAKSIHQQSNRNSGPFVAFDCGTLSKELVQSELFGHVKGAFTGAVSDKKGHFELANGGTLFLDEIANLSYDIQATLLRVIQERKVKRLGSTKVLNIDVRIIVASHENLRNAYQKHHFREDLFHRLNEFSVKVPPLRERKKDISAFSIHFLKQTNEETGKQITGFEEEVIELFSKYTWPGNIRELRNTIRKAVLLTSSGKINKRALPPELFLTLPEIEDMKDTKNITSQDSKHKNVNDLRAVSQQAEYETILKVLKAVEFNKSKAAKILHIDRKTLYNKIKDHGE